MILSNFTEEEKKKAKFTCIVLLLLHWKTIEFTMRICRHLPSNQIDSIMNKLITPTINREWGSWTGKFNLIGWQCFTQQLITNTFTKKGCWPNRSDFIHSVSPMGSLTYIDPRKHILGNMLLDSLRHPNRFLTPKQPHEARKTSVWSHRWSRSPRGTIPSPI